MAHSLVCWSVRRVGVRSGDARHEKRCAEAFDALGGGGIVHGNYPWTTAPTGGSAATVRRRAQLLNPRARSRARRLLDNGNGRAALDPAAVAKSGSDTRQSKGGIEGLIGRRVAAATEHALDGPNQRLMRAQKPVWDAICKYYFRLETSGWERLPEETSLLIGNHSGGSLTMDAWTFVFDWWRRFGTERVLHATAHDVLMATPGLGDYFRQAGVIPASRQGVSAALSAGCDVIIWPGGEVDAMRNWRRRDEAVLGGRHGFVRQAIRSGVPIVPVASVGGHDTAFVLSEGRWIANGLENIPGLKGLKKSFAARSCLSCSASPSG